MTDEQRPGPDDLPDASDVVEGPIGSAWLRDPATSGPMGADLGSLPEIDTSDDESEVDRPTEARTRPAGRP